MWPYWLLFLTPVSALLLSRQYGRKPDVAGWWAFSVCLMLFIGLREQIGGDWLNYLNNLDELMRQPVGVIFFTRHEPAYVAFSYLSGALGMGIYGVNFACAVVFVLGLADLCRRQPYPWLGMVVAVPYFVIVVAMGYTRQGAAIGALMLAIGALTEGKSWRFLAYVVLGSLFHKTSLILFGIFLFKPGSGAWKRLLGVGLVGGLIFLAFLAEQVEFLYTVYVERTMESRGGLIRVALNALPALILFVSWRRWGRLFQDRWIWAWFAGLTVLCLPMVVVASTAVDRMALYLIPIQIAVWARLPVLVQRWMRLSTAMALTVLLYALIQFIWLNLGDHAQYWLPYRNILWPEV